MKRLKKIRKKKETNEGMGLLEEAIEKDFTSSILEMMKYSNNNNDHNN